ncbi:MAG TPA: hypothetical protein VFV42_12060, partial [Acidimicrobiales bacterium]|nr:hypothetical protein [Acidimicrobiales bacterium]
SNSLLDGMVFGPRVVEAIDGGKDGAEPTGAMRCVLEAAGGIAGRELDVPVVATAAPLDGTAEEVRDQLQRSMTANAGVLRDEASLRVALADAHRALASAGSTVADAEVRNLAVLGAALATAARARTETRGSHTRTDHPRSDDALVLRFVVEGV